ncbi:roundabout homolog 4 isoform X3 [Pseudonaja textilis]|uniref:roundabout homolog 4 isoform X3 n=1 Tax=Pseudonaja textilis TaxID=8673 RepID=UPI000EA85A3A|nr:roundabout homolog 4 isoform X3 [Pseudonaja textilis]
MSRRKYIEPSRLWIWASFLLVEGSRSRSVEFAPQILDHPSNLVVRKDQPATLNCRADGNPAPTIEWYRNGKYVKPSKEDATSQPTLLPDGSLFFLRLSQEKGKSDEGVYHCLARNRLGKAMSKNASLYLEVLEEEFRLHPSDLKVTIGESWLLECVPPLGHPEPIISWKKNGVPLSAENGHYEFSKEKLLVAHAQKSDAGAYSCLAVNQVGEQVSRAATVTVFERPTFIRRPSDVVASVGSSVQFTCGIHGDPKLVVQWYKEDGELPSGRYEVDQENVLQIHHLTMCDAGKYICAAYSHGGTIFAKAALTVEDPLDTRQKEWNRPKDVTKELMDIRVCLVNVTIVPSAPAAHLHWKVTPTSQPIEAYKVFYHSLLPTKAHWAEWDVARDQQTIIPGLERGYKYEFKVRPYLGKIHGIDSNVRHLYIPEEVPSAAPQIISITVSRGGNSTVILHWEPPPPDTHNGIIKAYQVWFLGNETHPGFNRTVDGDTHSLETIGLPSGHKYCVKVAAINGAGVGIASNPVCGTAEPMVEKMAKSPDFLSTNYMLELVRQPVFIASVGSALWIMLMVLAVYVCQQQARQFGGGRRYALGEGLYRNASDDTIIKHRVDAGDSPWLSDTWKSTSGSKNYSTSSSLSSQLLWMESKDSQEFHKSTVSFDRQSQGSRIQIVPLVPDSSNSSPYGAFCTNLPAKDLKTFYSSLPYLSNPNLQSMELTQAGELMSHGSQNLRTDRASGQGRTQQGPWKTVGSLSPNRTIRGFWAKYDKKELQQVHSTPMSPSGFSADWSNHSSPSSVVSSGKHRRVNGRAKKVLKTYSSSKFSLCSSQNVPSLPPPPPIPPGFQAQALQDSSTKQEEPDDSDSTTSHILFPSHSYGYICGPLAIELLENDVLDEDEDPNMVEGPCSSTKFFRSSCQTPSSSLSEDEASLGGSLVNGWGSVSEDNGTSTRCSLVSSSDGSFLLDANFAQALAVAVDSFCFGLAKKEIDRPLTDFLPPASPLDGLLHPQALTKSSEEVQQKLGSQPLPVWEWSTDWVEEMEAKYMQPAENWEAAVMPGKGRIAAPEEAQLVPTFIQQGTNDKCCCSKVEGHLPGMLK